jgi:hypothetical protein
MLPLKRKFIEAIKDKKIIIEPNSPSDGVQVAFIEENGAPVELMQFTLNPDSSNKTEWGQRL